MGPSGRTAGTLLAVLPVVLLLLAGCSAPAGRSDTDCAWLLSYGGRTYVPAPIPESGGPGMPGTVRHQGTAIGQGHFAGCADGGGPGEGIALYRIAGASPEEAVITEDDVIGVSDPAKVPRAVLDLMNLTSVPTATMPTK